MKLYISFQKKSKKIVNHLKISEKKKKTEVSARHVHQQPCLQCTTALLEDNNH